MNFPQVRSCSEYISGSQHFYLLNMTTERGAIRNQLRVALPSHINKLINESKLISVSRKTKAGIPFKSTTVGEAVYAYRLLEKNGLASQYPDLLTQSIEEKRYILDMAFEMVEFLKKLEGA